MTAQGPDASRNIAISRDEALVIIKERYDQNDLVNARKLSQSLLRLNPDDLDALIWLGRIHSREGDLSSARIHYERVLAVDPDNYTACFEMGALFKVSGDYARVQELLVKALDLHPKSSEANMQLGWLHLTQGQYRQCIERMTRTLDLDPDNTSARFALIQGLRYQNRILESIEQCEIALKQTPGDLRLLGQYLYVLKRAGRFAAFDQHVAKFVAGAKAEVTAGRPFPSRPFFAAVAIEDPELGLLAGQSASARLSQMASGRVFSHRAPARGAGRIIRLGYLSAYFGSGPTSQLTLRLFELHDRTRFSVHGYSARHEPDHPNQKKIASDCDSFADISSLDDFAAAQRIKDDGIEILVHLDGFLQFNRGGICALRPAPLQISYLGFPGTTGAEFMDYILVDQTIVPESHRRFYGEKIMAMPACYQINNDRQSISEVGAERAAFGLPEDAIVFCCYNDNYKIDHATVRSWARILAAVPGSVMWLWKVNALTEASIRDAFGALGIGGDRIVFGSTLDKARHLARLRLADIALDCFVCNGHTTTSDALWAGLPVVTKLGRHFASRVAASLLGAAGLRELVAEDADAYERIAIELAREGERLAKLKARIPDTIATSPLYDTPGFVRDFERGLSEAWRRYCAGQQPDHIVIPPGTLVR